jgi:hypothetical protein
MKLHENQCFYLSKSMNNTLSNILPVLLVSSVSVVPQGQRVCEGKEPSLTSSADSVLILRPLNVDTLS